MVATSIRRAYSEVDTFLNLIDEESRNKVPEKLREFFKREKDHSYVKDIKSDIPVSNQNFQKETLAIIAFLNLHYWCDDEKEKQRLISIYQKNEDKAKKDIKEKLNFNNNITEYTTKIADKEVAIYKKESKLGNIINKILKFFHLK